MINENTSAKTIRTFFVYLLLIPVLLSGGCVARWSKTEEGKRNLTIRDRDPMRYYLDPYFRNGKKTLDTLSNYDFASNTIWVLVNQSREPVTLKLTHKEPGENGQETSYDFLLSKKTNKISFFNMKMGTYQGEMRRGDLVRQFQLSVEDR